MKSQSQIVHDIITQRLQWHLVNSEGKTVEKPAGANELTLLLSCYKSGITIVADGPGTPHPLQVELDEAHAGWKTARDEICQLREKISYLEQDLQAMIPHMP